MTEESTVTSKSDLPRTVPHDLSRTHERAKERLAASPTLGIPFPTRKSTGPLVERVTPQSLESEQSTLGAMLMERDAVVKALEILTPNHFYRELHKKIFAAIEELFNRGEPIDLITVVEMLRSRLQLDEVGGAAYLAALIESCPAAANIESYAKTVEEKAILRSYLSLFDYWKDRCYGEVEELSDLSNDIEKTVLEVGANRAHRPFARIKDFLPEVSGAIDLVYWGPEAGSPAVEPGLKTGFIDFDELTGGLEHSNLVIVGARPSMGKSAWACDILRHVGIVQGKVCAMFSLEMPKEHLLKRFIAAEAEVDLKKLRVGGITEEEWARINVVSERLHGAPIYIDDAPTLNVLEMRAKARRLHLEYGPLSLIVVDYLQKLHHSGKADNRVGEILKIVEGLKTMARELKVPVIALSQLSRAVESRDDKMPIMSDLRDGGSQEAEADICVFMYRPDYYRAAVPVDDYYGPVADTASICKFHLAKQRNGPTDYFELRFEKLFARFDNLAKDGSDRY